MIASATRIVKVGPEPSQKGQGNATFGSILDMTEKSKLVLRQPGSGRQPSRFNGLYSDEEVLRSTSQRVDVSLLTLLLLLPPD